MRDGVDQVPLEDLAPGRLFLTGLLTISDDAAGIVADTGADHVLCLVEEHELATHVPDYQRWLADSDLTWRLEISDFGVPSVDEAIDTASRLADRLRSGDNVIVHCFGGIGRTSLIASLGLVALGLDLDAALRLIADSRVGAGPERPEQRAFLDEVVATGRLLPTD